MAVGGDNEEIALFARQASNRGDIGIDQRARSIFESTLLADPARRRSPAGDRDRRDAARPAAMP
jgi:hypothetical protein